MTTTDLRSDTREGQLHDQEEQGQHHTGRVHREAQHAGVLESRSPETRSEGDTKSSWPGTMHRQPGPDPPLRPELGRHEGVRLVGHVDDRGH